MTTGTIQVNPLPAKIDRLVLPTSTTMDAAVAVPTVKGAWTLKYGKHAYYFMNFRTSSGLVVTIGHGDIIRPGLARVKKAAGLRNGLLSTLGGIPRRYHYGFNGLEQIMLMTVPHTVTSIGEGRFIVNLWSYCGYVLVDCRTKAVAYHTIDQGEDDHVLGSAQWFDPQSDQLYAMSYSLTDSFARIADPHRPVEARVFTHKIGSDATETVWAGAMADYMHEIIVNQTRQYCVVCELGMYLDEANSIIPSRVLVLDLNSGREWALDRFVVAAHARFDPRDPDVVYFSEHNFQFEHSSVFKLLRKASYAVRFRGPASVFKYRLTPDGPREIGVFTHPEFYRLTNMHVFEHRGRNVMAAMGFPDEVFLIDADTMDFIGKLRVIEPCSWKHLYSRRAAMIGTISPSVDGEKLFVQTTRSFQVVDVATGACDYVRDDFFNHSCSNHMLTCSDTAW